MPARPILNFLILNTLLSLLAGNGSFAQSGSTPAQGPANPPSAAAASPITAEGWLDVSFPKALHSKKLKEGDPVEAIAVSAIKNESGQTVANLPPGTKVLGTVTEVKLRSRHGEPSTLGIVFEKLHLPDGRELPFKGVISDIWVPPPPLDVIGGGPNNSPAWAGSNGTTFCTSGGPQPTSVPCGMSQPSVSESARQADVLRQDSDFNRAVKVPKNQGLAVSRLGVVGSSEKEVVIDTNIQLRLGFTMSAAH